jgi:hypothetical protein
MIRLLESCLESGESLTAKDKEDIARLRSKYRTLSEGSTPIGEDEPVMLFRAQDRFAAPVLDRYAEILEREVSYRYEACIDDGTADKLADAAARVRSHARLFRRWSKKKNPDCPAEAQSA